MIDFTQYQEQEPFILPEQKGIFVEKQKMYVTELKNVQEIFTRYIERGISGYIACNDSSLKNQYDSKYTIAQDLITTIETDSFWRYFDFHTPEENSAWCKHIDDVYDFYSNLLMYLSSIEHLMSFEYSYIDPLEDAWNISKKIFFELPTYNIFGYFDTKIKEFILFIQDLIQQLLLDSWTDILNQINSIKTNFDSTYSTFKDDIRIGAEDLRSIIQPLYNYINLINTGSRLIGNSWMTFGVNTELKNIMQDYSQVMSTDNSNPNTSKGNTTQITNSLITQMLKQDKSNLEMVMSKATKISLDKEDIKQKLIDIHNSFVII